MTSPYRTGGLLLASRLSLCALPLVLPSLAYAEKQVQAYNIPAGPLEQVLGRYAQAAGAPISLQSQQLRGLTSPGINGTYTVLEGFAQVLRGTGLTVHNSDDGYVLQKVPVSAGALELDATNISAAVLGSTTEGTGSYTTGETAAATRMNLSLRRTRSQ